MEQTWVITWKVSPRFPSQCSTETWLNMNCNKETEGGHNLLINSPDPTFPKLHSLFKIDDTALPINYIIQYWFFKNLSILTLASVLCTRVLIWVHTHTHTHTRHTHIHISHTCTTYNTHHTYTHTDITSVHLYISHTHTPHTLQKYTSHTITTHTPHTLTPEAKYSGILVINISRLCVFVIMSFVISTQLIKPREISVFLSISFKVHFFITT